jgi:hypothetical protein
MSLRSLFVLLALVIATPGYAEPPSIRRVARVEAARLARAEITAARERPAASPPRQRNWAQRHPVVSGALVGGGTGFLIGYLPGDDGVFYDFTAGFNGTVLAGVGAGAGAASVALVRALRR